MLYLMVLPDDGAVEDGDASVPASSGDVPAVQHGQPSPAGPGAATGGTQHLTLPGTPCTGRDATRQNTHGSR